MAEQEFCLLTKGGEGEIVEKKSRFIAQVFPVLTEQEAYQKIAEVKKQHYNARHHCFAFAVGDQNPLYRSSDDGEPQGTAGKPILEVLEGERLTNALVVVTRYFGGTLLGTGGLVRAYANAAKEGLAHSEIAQRKQGVMAELVIDYNDWGKIQYLMETMGLYLLEVSYAEQVKVQALLPQGAAEAFRKKLQEATAGRVREEQGTEAYYILCEDKPRILNAVT